MPCATDLKGILIQILGDFKVCIAHEINDRAYYNYGVPFESFRDLREKRGDLILEETIKEIIRPSPYGKPYKFYHLISTDTEAVDTVLRRKYRLLLEYSKYTTEIGHFGEELVSDAVLRLGFTEVEVRKRIGMKDIDVWCKDLSEDFYWAIEVKNRRQEISQNDIDDALFKATLASEAWNIKCVEAAIVSSSVYNRIPEDPDIPIITTGRVYVPNNTLFRIYKESLGSWYIEIVEDLPNELVESIQQEFLIFQTTTEAYPETIEVT